MTKTFAIAAAAIAITAVTIGTSMASPCHYKNGYTTYTPAPVYTHNVTYTPYYNGY